MDKRNIHFMGVGGSGCSAAFALAFHNGYKVSGCDKERYSPYLDKDLAKYIKTGHSSKHLEGVDLLLYSPAIVDLDQHNEEFKAAKEKNIEAAPWEEFVARELLKDKFVIAIGGTHGKGTTAAMLAYILEYAGLDPSSLIGAVVNDWGKNYRIGNSKYFIIEVDEYKERFLKFSPNIAVITNVEFDHPEYFKDFAALRNAFKKFVNKLKRGSILIVGPDIDLKNANGETIVVSSPIDYELKMVGKFNKVNAALASEIARKLSIPDEKIKVALEKFNGIARRFDFIGEENEVMVFEDYAHHPTALSKTLGAAREKFPERRIWAVFQPHLFTRVKVLFDDFVSSFEDAPVDEIIVVDIFGAREKSGDIGSSDLAQAVKNKKVKYIPSFEDAASYVKKEVSVGDIVISMGAGDIYKFPRLLLRKLGNIK